MLQSKESNFVPLRYYGEPGALICALMVVSVSRRVTSLHFGYINVFTAEYQLIELKGCGPKGIM